MATKKTSRKRKAGSGIPLLDTDPPILVGGGGSAYIWVKLDDPPIPVNPGSDNPNTGVNPGAPTPKTRNIYSCSRVSGVYKRIIFFDGADSHTMDIKNPKKFHVQLIPV